MGVLACAAVAAFVAAVGCGGSPTGETAVAPTVGTPPARTVSVNRAGISGELPAGWRLIRDPIPELLNPRPVFAAATVPASRLEPKGCSATRNLPKGEALVTVIEYSDVNDYGPRAHPPLGFRGGHYASFDCFGEGWMFNYRSDGRALQAHIAADRQAIVLATKSEALRVLNSLEYDRPPPD